MKIFVIMPFSKTTDKHGKKYWDDFFDRLCDIVGSKLHDTIKQLFHAEDIRIHRAAAPQGNIPASILKDLRESDIVIAVLTDHNPNVFYELGVRHTQSNKTIMLCEESQRIPFDLKNYGVGLYKDGKLRYRHIERELVERFKQIAGSPNKPDNPFHDFIVNPKATSKSTTPDIKVSIVDRIEGESLPHPPTFYREARRDGGEVHYEERTFFTFAIELMNYAAEPISIVDTELEGQILGQRFSTNEVIIQNSINTARASVTIRPSYKKKCTLEARKIHQHQAAFVLNQFVPHEVSKIQARVHVTDMFDHKHSSPPISFSAYR